VRKHAPAGSPLTARHGFFWVGVTPRPTPYGTVPGGQMFVEWLAPAEVTRPHPIVLVHGGGGQGTDWLGTPDGRPGWAPMLVRQGFTVYVVDRPGHGRSPFHEALLGPMGPPGSYEALQQVFAPPAFAEGHTEWPGVWGPGDEATDQFVAGTGPMIADWQVAHTLERECLAELLEATGKAILVSHSAGGPAGFVAADARPELVVALVAIEPVGPPFLDMPEVGIRLPWGLAASPLTYDPPADDPADLGGNAAGRRLPNLARVPIAVMSSTHSPIAQADPATVAFLEAGGCDVTALRLADHGLHGNGHGLMFERNNAETLGVLVEWLERTGVA
jgi:pimeloyl-ACP methyl ester carboxylesterase